MAAEYAKNVFPFVQFVARTLNELYWYPLHQYLEKNPQLLETFTGFLLQPDQLVFYVGKSHIAIEYVGPERIDKIPPLERTSQLQYFDYTQTEENFFEQIIGFRFDANHDISFPIPSFSEDLLIPTNRGFDKLHELGWDFAAQEAIMGFNFCAPTIPKEKFARIVNGFFFDSNDNGLITRRIKWIDFVPILFDDSDDEFDKLSVNLNFYKKLVEPDAQYLYPLPHEFRFEKLQTINRFIELIGYKHSSETDITSFLAHDLHKFILTMRFGAENVFGELSCDWQSEQRESIRPDFFVLQPNGYADIVEFKLPNLKTKTVVGKPNRESFSAEINAYISQTRVYQNYFDDPNNRIWFERKYGFKVLKPRRILVAGRRSDFSNDYWQSIKSDYQNIDILTYDDLIDGVIAQFYL